MKHKTKITIVIMIETIFLFIGSLHAERYMEKLDRGVVAVRSNDSQVFISWRMFGTDPSDIGFNVYRGSTRLNSSPIIDSTNYVDNTSENSTYSVKPVINGQEQAASASVDVWEQNYFSVPLQIPPNGTTPDGKAYGYIANDCSVGDLDGDGEYEIILKWDPTNAHDNAHDGYTGNVFLDAYKQNGTFLWRIDMGINIRAGAHYTQFMVYDLDSDGKAEVACKTADGTVDGVGDVIGDGDADYRSTAGRILSGPEFLTIFNGQTGAALVTTDYIPPRGNLADWGDTYGNRSDRFLACIAYLDGVRPSLVMCRGYYTSRDGRQGKTVLAAWDWRNGQLTQRWIFDANPSNNSDYIGQGNHNLSVGDVDDDGMDEIVYGACCIDHDGTGLWSTGLGHGDAMHLSDLDPDRPGLEKWGIHEGSGTPGSALLDARTGEILWQTANSDAGRGVAADLTASYRGAECWGGTNGLRSITNEGAGSTPSSTNHVIWWDGDLLRELLDGTYIRKYGGDYLLKPTGCASNNGSKSNPCLQVDMFGDWREEVIVREGRNDNLRIYTTTTTTSHRIYTLMHDPQYRLSIAWQNVAYNQPPHTGFYLGDGMSTPPIPNIKYPGDATPIAHEKAQQQKPKEFVLEQNYPNPFNSSTTIRYRVPEKTSVQLKIYNILGEEIRTLVNSKKQSGIYEIQWDGKDSREGDVPTGVYYYQLRTDEFLLTRRLIILR